MALPISDQLAGSTERLGKSRERLTKVFDPHEARDSKGRWTHGGHLMHDATKEMLSTSAQIAANNRMGGPSRNNGSAIEVTATKKFRAGTPLSDAEKETIERSVIPTFKREYPRSGARHESAEVALKTPRRLYSGEHTDVLNDIDKAESDIEELDALAGHAEDEGDLDRAAEYERTLAARNRELDELRREAETFS